MGKGRSNKTANKNAAKGRKGKKEPDHAEEDRTVKAKPTAKHRYPVPGLTNLGNTCFFNAVLQNISQSSYFLTRLTRLLRTQSYSLELKLPEYDVSRQLSITAPHGLLTKALHQLLEQMSTQGGGIVHPGAVLSEVCKQAPRFKGHEQQDSQELLRYLLDSLRTEEINRRKRAILLSFNVSAKPNTDSLTEKDRKDIKAYGHQAGMAPTFVDEVFAGQLMSSVECKSCQYRSVIYEDFMDLCLSIPANEVASIPSYMARGKNQKKDAESKKISESVTASPPKSAAAKSKHHQKKDRQLQHKPGKRTKSNRQHLKLQEKTDEPEDMKLQEKTDEPEEMKLQEKTDEPEEMKLQEKTDEPEEMTEGPVDTAISTAAAAEVCEADPEGTLQSTTDEAPCTTSDTIGGTANPDTIGGTANPDTTGGTANPDNVVGTATQTPVGDGAASTVLTVEDSSPVCPAEDTNVVQTEHSCVKEEDKLAEQLSSTSLSCTTAVASGASGCTEEKGQSSADNATTSTGHALLGTPREAPGDSALLESLRRFCAVEELTGDNKFACPGCRMRSKGLNHCDPAGRGLDHPDPLSSVPSHPGPQSSTPNHPDPLSSVGELLCNQQTSVLDCMKTDLSAPITTVDVATAAKPTCTGERHIPTDEEGSQPQSLDDEKCPFDHMPHTGARNHDDSAQDGGTPPIEEEIKEEEEEEEEDDDEGDPLLSVEVSIGSVEESKGSSVKDKDVVYSNMATKQMLVTRPPLVLVLCLKRFIHQGKSMRKNNAFISFPLVLDLTPFCTESCQQRGRVQYSLYGIVEHSGGMHGGHYVAYVNARKPDSDVREPNSSLEKDAACAPCLSDQPVHVLPPQRTGDWYYMSDTHVRPASEAEVLKAQAYLLFYERIS